MGMAANNGLRLGLAVLLAAFATFVGVAIGGAAGNSITSPDTAGDVGDNGSLVLDSAGKPVVAYHDQTNHALKVLHCGDPDCASGNSITSPDTAGDVGWFTSIALDAAGNPVVSYRDNGFGDLKVLHCGNANCTAGNSITVPDVVGNTGWYTSLALDSAGFPVVAYVDSSGAHLRILHCGDANCSSGNTIASPDPAGGAFTSLMLDSAGNPVVSYYGVSLSKVTVLHCGNAACTSGNSITRPAYASGTDGSTSLALDAAGNPVVVFQNGLPGEDLVVMHCNDANCASSDESLSVPDPGGKIGTDLSIQLDAMGFPVVSYFEVFTDFLKVLHCGNANCTSGNSIASPDPTFLAGHFTSLRLDAAGDPVVSYYDDTDNRDLKLLYCGDPTCGAPPPATPTPTVTPSMTPTATPTATPTPTRTPPPVGGVSLDPAALSPGRRASHRSAAVPFVELALVGVSTTAGAIYFARRRLRRYP
jgi:hypothetical protein